MRDIQGAWMQDVEFRGRCLRVFWRGFRCPQMPYLRRWLNLWTFGAGPLGFMYWPKREEQA